MVAHAQPDPLYLATSRDARHELDAILADAEALAFDDCPIAAGSLVKLARDQLQQGTCPEPVEGCPDCRGELGHVAGTINGPAWLDCPTCGAGGPTIGTDLPCDCPPPEPDPDMLTACQAEARFGLEEARDLLLERSGGKPGTRDAAIIARIDQAISVLP